MAIRWASAGWKADHEGRVDAPERIYIDFRNVDYPSQDGASTFTLVSSGDNQSGSHLLTGGYGEYLIPMPTKFVIQVRAKANFAYDVATSQPLIGWSIGTGSDPRCHYIYQQASDKFTLGWFDGVSARSLESQQFDDGSSHADISTWRTHTVSVDLTTGTTAGSQLWIDKTSRDTTWSGNIDAKVTDFPRFRIRRSIASTGDYQIAWVRMWLGRTATDAEVQANFSAIKDEEIFWPLDGYATGKTRCNVTSYVTRIQTQASATDIASGDYSSNRSVVTLNNPQGIFSDDQYAAYAPASAQYNGTSTQKYLTKRCRAMIETWYGDDFEPVIVGRVDENNFARSTDISEIGSVNVTIQDGVADIANSVIDDSVAYEDHPYVNNVDETNSLLHKVVRLASQREVRNYLGNSSFENATIGNSWLATSGSTISREASGLFGTYCGQIVWVSSTAKRIYQVVTFLGEEKIGVGDVFTFSAFLRAGASFSRTTALQVEELAGTTVNDSSAVSYSLVADSGWLRHSVSHTITNSTSDRIRVSIYIPAEQTLQFDGAQLERSATASNVFVLNATDGASGIISADQYATTLYDTHGFDLARIDTDASPLVVPWRLIPENVPIWEEAKSIANACLPRYFGMDAAGTMTFRSSVPLVPSGGGTMPTSQETFTDDDIVSSIATRLSVAQANKVTVYSSRIWKSNMRKRLWTADTTNGFSEWDASDEAGDHIVMRETVLNNGYFPSPSTFGEYWAVYGEETTMSEAYQKSLQPEVVKPAGGMIGRMQTIVPRALQAWDTMIRKKLGIG